MINNLNIDMINKNFKLIKKRGALIGLVTIMGFTMTACGGNKTSETETSIEETTNPPFEMPGDEPPIDVGVYPSTEESTIEEETTIEQPSYYIPLVNYEIQSGDTFEGIAMKVYFPDGYDPYVLSHIKTGLFIINGYNNSKEAGSIYPGQIIKVFDVDYLNNNPEIRDALYGTIYKDYIEITGDHILLKIDELEKSATK